MVPKQTHDPQTGHESFTWGHGGSNSMYIQIAGMGLNFQCRNWFQRVLDRWCSVCAPTLAFYRFERSLSLPIKQV